MRPRPRGQRLGKGRIPVERRNVESLAREDAGALREPILLGTISVSGRLSILWLLSNESRMKK